MSSTRPHEHQLEWVTAAALWPRALATGADASAEQRTAMRRPALLRFASDSFMEDLARQLETAPARLVDHEATPQSFRVRPPGVPEDWEPGGAPPPLKLYQPTHGHFNLVAASLVCQLPGLPDRAVRPAEGDRVSFVLRRLHDGAELAWVADPLRPGGHGWGKAAGATVAPGEELLPLFPAEFSLDDRHRRLFVGLLPTSSRESYLNAGPVSLPVDSTQADPRVILLMSRVADPLADLAKQKSVDPTIGSPFIAIELAGFLAENLPGWREILDGATPSPTAPQWTLYQQLTAAAADAGNGFTWLDAVQAVWADRVALCGEQGTPSVTLDLSAADTAIVGFVVQALPVPAPPPAGTPSAPDPAAQPVAKLTPDDQTRYVVRCVYQRPQCGPLHDDVVGDPSADFAIASFFDFDAPQRTVQISLPIDTSPASLRKARKNVSLMLSDQLKQQLSRVSDLKSMTEGNLNSPSGGQFGLVCSFSIPIITICALFVLIIFISLLNIVFWWMPFFRLCLPLGLKAKS